ncbi:MAG: PEP-CTERM sorting domain-containing protein [Deltaproteobacteria bacterium]|nr:PEP-CTERM sorting domain-containing protein [Deltaproteobacteria bacterium]
MRKFCLIISVIGVFLFIVAGTSNATTIDFGDNAYYWTGWPSSNSDGYGDDNLKDTIGTPQISGGSVTIENGKLNSVTIRYSNSSSLVAPGDLFIDLGGNLYWDYVVDTDAAGNNIYSFGDTQFALNYNYYDLSDTTWGSHPGYVIRNDHPVLYNNATLGITPNGTATIDSGMSVGSDLTFTYSDLNLDLDGASSFIIGWTVNCANDVLYEPVNTPVPAPTTLLLVGSGLLGLVSFVRRKKIL